jgi:hypothetical protein
VLIARARLEERTLVGRHAQPRHAVENGAHDLVGRTLLVGILDAQDEHAAVATREQPIEDRGAGAADVQEAGRGGCEADPDAHGTLSPASFRSSPKCLST